VRGISFLSLLFLPCFSLFVFPLFCSSLLACLLCFPPSWFPSFSVFFLVVRFPVERHSLFLRLCVFLRLCLPFATRPEQVFLIFFGKPLPRMPIRTIFALFFGFLRFAENVGK
jgi:hypothetical protein